MTSNLGDADKLAANLNRYTAAGFSTKVCKIFEKSELDIIALLKQVTV